MKKKNFNRKTIFDEVDKSNLRFDKYTEQDKEDLREEVEIIKKEIIKKEMKAIEVIKKSTTTVTAAICPSCEDTIFSRASHDFHYCSCGKIAIDGGFEYVKMCFEKIAPKLVKIKISATKKELFDDWNKSMDKFGIIRKN